MANYKTCTICQSHLNTYFDDEGVTAQFVKKVLPSYINFTLLNTLRVTNKPEISVVQAFSALLILFQDQAPWIPRDIKDWSVIQRTISNTTRFLALISNFQNYTIQESKIQAATKILNQQQIANQKGRGQILLKIVSKLVEFYSNPFNKSIQEEKLDSPQFQMEQELLSPIEKQNSIYTDNDSQFCFQHSHHNKGAQDSKFYFQLPRQISLANQSPLFKKQIIRTRSPTTPLQNNKKLSLQRLSIPFQRTEIDCQTQSTVKNSISKSTNLKRSFLMNFPIKFQQQEISQFKISEVLKKLQQIQQSQNQKYLNNKRNTISHSSYSPIRKYTCSPQKII